MSADGRKKKILVTTTTLPRFHGDPEPRFVLDLCRSLQAHFDVTLLAPADPAAALEEILEGVRVVRYRYAPMRSLERLAYPGAILPRIKANPVLWTLVPMLFFGLYVATRRLLRTENFACVHAHWLLPQGFVQRYGFSRSDDPPYVVTSHGGDVYSLNSRLFHGLYRRVIEGAAALTVVSGAIEAYVQNKITHATDGGSIRVIPMGVDLDRFHPRYRDEGWAERNGLTRPTLLFVGRLAEKKGLQYLIEAMAMEPLRSTPATLAIVGDGPLRDTLIETARRLGIGSKVRFLKALSHDALATVMASCDIFCAPSITAKGGDTEGLPTVLCEAAASGLPAVATTVGGIPEVVVDGETGTLVPEKDAVALAAACHRYVVDPALRRRAGEEARRHIAQFGWPNIARQFAEVIDDAIVSRRGRRLVRNA